MAAHDLFVWEGGPNCPYGLLGFYDQSLVISVFGRIGFTNPIGAGLWLRRSGMDEPVSRSRDAAITVASIFAIMKSSRCDHHRSSVEAART
jgi:hypothetical protein